MTEGIPHVYRARLDFLYQSIAVYAVALVLYLIARSSVASEAFPSLWQDPFLLLLSAITLISVLALLYNVFMGRQIEIAPDAIRFKSRALERVVARTDVAFVQFGPRFRQPRGRIRVVRLKMKGSRRAVRIRLSNFDRRKQLLADLRGWAGTLARGARPDPRKDHPLRKEPS
ncbi:MAG: hypothetical protein Q8922_11210 [Bacteroidota bacterium]|nr:hypothetical protein [Bacteroidota bacterium]MDP4233968.1 hypothetical protein [Bacteroidota bacterium]MDP4242781.1 hypothetical protein [Bacteroidota bacterium]MDP4288495.1 hypothetical protein [Bacteroidota bacterium]